METRLYLKKIDIDSTDHIQLKQGLDDYMNSYERYFDRAVPITMNTEIENTKGTQQDINSQSQIGNNYFITFSLKKPRIDRNLPLLTPSSSKKDFSLLRKNTQMNYKKTSGGYVSVTEKEIKAIFDNFRRIKKDNYTKERINSGKEHGSLQMQENALDRYNYHQIEHENMKEKLSQSLKRGKETLLIHSIEDYREKNEEKILGSRITRNKDYWYDSLRQPVEKEKLSKKTFFKNFGTYQNPKWKITSMNHLTERIRSPTKRGNPPSASVCSELNKNSRYSSTLNTLDDLSEESEENEQKEKSVFENKSLQLAGLSVVGKDLLEFEAEHFNDMKNRCKKFYYCQAPSSPGDKFEILSSNQKIKEQVKE